MSSRGGKPRNVQTYLDNHALYRDLIRDEGEGVSQFKARNLASLAKKPGPTINGMTQAIDIALGLGQEYLISLTTSKDYYLEINNVEIIISGETYNKVPLVNIDAGGYWFEKPLYQLQTELNAISGITATLDTQLSGLPAYLLEQQSSYHLITEERVPSNKRFRLGAIDNLSWNNKKLVLDTVHFNDDSFFAVKVSGNPRRENQWSVSEDGYIQLYSAPSELYFVDYQYNIFVSGQTMKLTGNGVKVINLAADDTQQYLLLSGYAGEARAVSFELLSHDRMFWGK